MNNKKIKIYFNKLLLRFRVVGLSVRFSYRSVDFNQDIFNIILILFIKNYLLQNYLLSFDE